MKYIITAQVEGKSANEVASKLLMAAYVAEVELEALDVELVPPTPTDIRQLAEEGPSDETNHSETFHFPHIQELIEGIGKNNG
jgi:hypothetical protein